ncbi:MAG: peptidase M28, partial [Erysipelotrichaceae bacterium]|nr:peptidase M28 [Erysipelotrichaceae bacterium]
MEKEMELLKKLSEVNGVPGHEHLVAKLFKDEVANIADKIEYDNLGSIIAYKNGKTDGPVVLLAGHMDEVGFIINRIESSGLLRIHPLGGWWNHVVLAELMTVTTREGKTYVGVTGAQPPHGMKPEERNRVLETKELYLDLGVKDRDAVVALGISVGDTVTPKTDFRVMNDGKTLLGKAWDDRVGVAVGIEVLKALKDEKIDATVAVAGTVQEEVGLRGARTVGYKVKPDVAFAIDVTMSNDLPASPNDPTKLGAGVALSIMDASVIAHKGLFNFVEAVAKEHNIKYTYDLL